MTHWLYVTGRTCVGAVILALAVFAHAADRHDHRTRAAAPPAPRALTSPARPHPLPSVVSVPSRNSRLLFTVLAPIGAPTVRRYASG